MGKTTSINLAAIKFIQETTLLGFVPSVSGTYSSVNDISNNLDKNNIIVVPFKHVHRLFSSRLQEMMKSVFKITLIKH